MRRARNLTAAAVLMMAAMAGSARAEVLDVVPSDAVMVVRVKNLEDVSKKIADLSQKLGLAGMAQQMNDPLGAIKQQTGVSAGINNAGDAAMVVLKPVDEESEEPPVVVLIPVSDYQAFIGNFQNSKTEGDVTTVTLPTDVEPSYVAKWGDYAALAPKREFVAAKGAGIKVAGVSAETLAGNDLVVWANMPALRPLMADALDEMQTMVMSEMEDEMAADDADSGKFLPVAKVAVTQYFTAINSFFRDSEAAMLTMNLAPGGIQFGAISEFKGGSYIGNINSQLKSVNSSFTAGLPSTPYAFYGGYTANSEVLNKLLEDIGGPILKEVNALGEEAQAKSVNEVLDAAKAMISASREVRQGILAPRSVLGEQSLFQTVTLIDGDVKAIQGSLEKYTTGLSAILTAMGEMPGQGKMDMGYQADARNVAGVSFAAIKVNVTPPENDAEAAQAMAMIYGPDGLNQYIGAIDDDTVMMFAGLTDDQAAAAVNAAKAGENKLATQKGFALTQEGLPAQRVGVMYIALDEIARSGIHYAQSMGVPVQITLPPNLPPIGVTVGAEGNVMRVQGYVPTPLMQAMVSAGLQAFMGMGGGGDEGF